MTEAIFYLVVLLILFYLIVHLIADIAATSVVKLHEYKYHKEGKIV